MEENNQPENSEKKSEIGKSVEEVLEAGAQNIMNAENITTETVRAYSSILDTFEDQGYNVDKYRTVAREAYKRLEQKSDNPLF